MRSYVAQRVRTSTRSCHLSLIAPNEAKQYFRLKDFEVLTVPSFRTDNVHNPKTDSHLYPRLMLADIAYRKEAALADIPGALDEPKAATQDHVFSEGKKLFDAEYTHISPSEERDLTIIVVA